jgi:NitT/TauT family transport system ATP-binding protein
MPLLEVQALGKRRGEGAQQTAVLEDLSFAVEAGEFVSVVGPSGCGKTTLLMTLAGLLRADTGRVAFKGIAVTGTPPGIAIVFQDYSRSLLPWMNNVDNVLMGMRRLEGIGASEKRRAALELLAAVGLGGFEERYPWEVSGGMQQRVAIARALASRSELLLLDEPLAALDAQTRADMQDLLLSLAQRYAQTCILVTHDIDEAVYLSNRVLVVTRRPARLASEIGVDIPYPREQFTVRESPRFLQLRHEIAALINRIRQQGDPVC